MNVANRAPVILLFATASACTVTDPLFCDETHHCADPARPFCDLRGEYPASEGIARTCIPDPSPDGGPGAPMDFSIAVPSGRLFIRQGESAALDVTVERDAEFDEPIAVALDGLPAGVVAAPLTIASGETAGILNMSAASDSTQGALDLEVTGAAGDLARSAPLRLVVAGPPGTLDRSFATGGRFTLRLGGVDNLGAAVMVQRDDKIVVSGNVASQAGEAQAITLRLDANGTLDDSFGLDGVASPGIGQASAGGVVLGSGERRILVGGLLSDGGVVGNALFAYTVDGQLDTTFGKSGVVTMDSGTAPHGVLQILQLDSGDILTVGLIGDDIGNSILRVARHTADGTTDPSFDITQPLLEPAAAILDQSGRLVVAGQKLVELDFSSFVARYLPDGAPDVTFGEDGVVETNLLADQSFEGATGLVELDDGKLLTTGVLVASGPLVLALARYNPNGVRDSTFGQEGTLITETGLGTRLNAALLDQQQRIVIAGRSGVSNTPTVVRILPDGALDLGFGSAGVATIDFGVTGDPIDGANGLAVDADGRIVMAGSVGEPGNRSIAVARLWP